MLSDRLGIPGNKAEFIIWKQTPQARNIWNLFPETFTHVDNLNNLRLLFNFKVNGFDYRTNEESVEIMKFLQEYKVILVDGYTIKKNPLFLS